MTAPDAATVLAVVAGAGLLVAVLALSSRLVGQVAESFGEDPVRWQRTMLPFGPLGPLVAWLLLSRRGGPPA